MHLYDDLDSGESFADLDGGLSFVDDGEDDRNREDLAAGFQTQAPQTISSFEESQ